MNRKIQDIEGIGPKYTEMLSKVGIINTNQLLAKGGTPKGRNEIAESSGVSVTLIFKWVNMCDLFRVKGVKGQYAELLESAGVDTVKELGSRNAACLTEKMLEVNREKRLVRAVPGRNAVEGWIEHARNLDQVVEY